MLRELHIKNLILVKECAIFFKKGLNIITGETGAGKSVIIGSLSLVLGDRSSDDIIRKGEDKCSVEAVFDLPPSSELMRLLSESGIDGEDDTLIVKRELVRSGSNRQFVNGSPVPVALLKKIGNLLLDIHGQHDHQSLFNIDTHRRFLDWFAKQHTAVQTFSDEYVSFLKTQERLSDYKNSRENRERDRKFWEYELQEITTAQLQETEEEDLDREYTIISHAKEIAEKSTVLYEMLYGGENSIRDMTGVIRRELNNLSKFDNFFETRIEMCDQINALCEQLADEIRQRGEMCEYNTERLQEIEQRLQGLEKIKRKFNKSISDIIGYAAFLKDKLKQEESCEEEIQSLTAECELKLKNLREKADILSRKRQESSRVLAEHIEGEFKRLGMSDARMRIAVEKGDNLTACGWDNVEFMFAPNKGEEWSALRKSASGGEISRIMLALKSTFVDADNIGVMVFDEIDVNIGGKTARDVGKRLYDLSRTHQILCITHLPQIASMGDVHFKVEKNIIEGRTITEITELDKAMRIDEIARMLGGENLTSVIRTHAQELLEETNKMSI